MAIILEYKGCVDRSRPMWYKMKSDLNILLPQSLFLGRLFPDLGPWRFFSSFLLIILPFTWRSCSPTIVKALTIPQVPKSKRPDHILETKSLGHLLPCSLFNGRRTIGEQRSGRAKVCRLCMRWTSQTSVRAKSTNSQLITSMPTVLNIDAQTKAP